jgi:hypothetical protein
MGHYGPRAYAASVDLSTQLATINDALDTAGKARQCREVRPRVQVDLKVFDSAPDPPLRSAAQKVDVSLLAFLDDCAAGDGLAFEHNVSAMQRAIDAFDARLKELSKE